MDSAEYRITWETVFILEVIIKRRLLVKVYQTVHFVCMYCMFVYVFSSVA